MSIALFDSVAKTHDMNPKTFWVHLHKTLKSGKIMDLMTMKEQVTFGDWLEERCLIDWEALFQLSIEIDTNYRLNCLCFVDFNKGDEYCITVKSMYMNRDEEFKEHGLQKYIVPLESLKRK